MQEGRKCIFVILWKKQAFQMAGKILNSVYDAIKRNTNKIFVLWFHGRCHIEEIDVRLLNRTEDRNDVSTWNLVHMLHRHRYTTLFSWNFKFELRLKVTWLVDSLLPWKPIQNIQDMIMCLMLPSTFVPRLTSMGCLTFELEIFQYLANQRNYYVTMATNV